MQTSKPDAPAATWVARTDDVSIRQSVSWVGAADARTSGVDPTDAELITGALSAATLLAMALLPLTARPRRRGNPGLRAALRAGKRRVAGDSAPKPIRPAAATVI